MEEFVDALKPSTVRCFEQLIIDQLINQKQAETGITSDEDFAVYGQFTKKRA